METKKLYECLLLLDPALAASDWDGITGKIKSQIEKRGGEVVSLKKWDERQLAYEIQKKNRGTYVLVYFKNEPSAIVAIERDFNLDEQIIRTMILRADFITSDEQMDKQAPTITDFRLRAATSGEESWRERRLAEVKDLDDVEEITDDDDDDEEIDVDSDAEDVKESE